MSEKKAGALGVELGVDVRYQCAERFAAGQIAGCSSSVGRRTATLVTGTEGDGLRGLAVLAVLRISTYKQEHSDSQSEEQHQPKS